MTSAHARAASQARLQLDPISSGRVALSASTLRFGRRTLATADVAGVRIDSGERSGLIGNICGLAVFLGIAAVLMSLIVGQVLPGRTLIGVVTLGCVGLFCSQDAWLERGTGFYRLWMRTKDGREEMVFATSVRGEIDMVWSQLATVLPPDVEVDAKAGVDADAAPAAWLHRIRTQRAWR